MTLSSKQKGQKTLNTETQKTIILNEQEEEEDLQKSVMNKIMNMHE